MPEGAGDCDRRGESGAGVLGCMESTDHRAIVPLYALIVPLSCYFVFSCRCPRLSHESLSTIVLDVAAIISASIAFQNSH